MDQAKWNDVLMGWLHGMGGTFHFQDGDYFAEQLRRDPYLAEVLARIGAQIMKGKTHDANLKNYYNDAKGGTALGEQDGLHANWTVKKLGSYAVEWGVVENVGGKATVSLHVTNQLSNSSVAHYANKAGLHSQATGVLRDVNPVPRVGADITLTVAVPLVPNSGTQPFS